MLDIIGYQANSNSRLPFKDIQKGIEDRLLGSTQSCPLLHLFRKVIATRYGKHEFMT